MIVGKYISDPSLNGHLHYPNDFYGQLNEDTVDKIRQYHHTDTHVKVFYLELVLSFHNKQKYHTDYNNRPSTTISFMFAILSTSGRLHCEFV